MKTIADLHMHTVASTHAHSTIHEMAQQAMKNGLRAIAITDHGIGMPDSPHRWYFGNITEIPHVIEDELLLLKGVEANALDAGGHLDMDEKALKRLDWVIVSLHKQCIAPLNYDEATDLWLRVAENPYVDMIGHCEQKEYYFDYDRVTKVFAKNNKVVEINGNSPFSRSGNEENIAELITCCKRNGTKLAVNSDAHSLYDLGKEAWALDLLEEMDFPPELVINSSTQRLVEELALHKKPVAATAKALFGI